MSTINDTDLLLVERNGVQYQITYDQMSTLNDDDLLLVERGGVQYKVEAQHVSTGANGLIIPPVEVLTPVNGAGITEFDSYEPVSSAITAVGEAGTVAKETDDIQSVAAAGTQPAEVYYMTSAPTNLADVLANGVAYVDGQSLAAGSKIVFVRTATSTAQVFSSNGTTGFIMNGDGAGFYSADGTRLGGGGSYNSGEYTLFNYDDEDPSTASPIYKIQTHSSVAYTVMATSAGTGPTLNAAAITTLKSLSFPTNTNFSGLSVGDVVQGGTIESPVMIATSTLGGTDFVVENFETVDTTSTSVQTPSTFDHASRVKHLCFYLSDATSDIQVNMGGSGWNTYSSVDGVNWVQGTTHGGGSALVRTLSSNNPSAKYFLIGGLTSGDLFSYWSTFEFQSSFVSNWTPPYTLEMPVGGSITPAVEITAIDASAPSITVNGGTWDTSNQSQVWSDASRFVSSNGFNSSYPATNAFDGSSGTYAQAATSGGSITFTPSTPIPYSSSIKILMPSAGAQAVINGGSAVNVGNSVETTIASGSGTLTSLVLTASNIPGVIYIKVDDNFLIDAVEDSQAWGDYITISEGLEGNYNTDTTNMFDGDTSTATSLYSGNSRPTTVVLTPPSPITVTSGLRVYMAVDRGQSISVNGSQTNASVSAGWNNTGFTGTLTTLTIGPANAGSSSNINAIEIDGKLMLTPGVRNFGDRSLSSSITYEKSLTFTDDTQLANMVGPLEMTDANGDVVTPVSDTIANVSGNVLTLQGDTNLAYFQPGDEVQTGVQVVSVDAAAPSITVDGGSWLGADGSGSTYEISKSLRFNSADQAFLSRTPTIAGNRKTWTWSGWMKFDTLTGEVNIFNGGTSSSNDFTIKLRDGSLWVQEYAGLWTWRLRTDGYYLFRDPANWQNLVVAFDSTQSTETDRIKIYINGVQQTNFSVSTYPNLNHESLVNSTNPHYFAYSPAYNYSSFYLAEVNFIDGQALAPTAFGDFDSNGIWQAKEFDGSHNAEGIGGTINTLEFTGNGPHGPHAIRVDGVILTGADYTNGTLGSWSSNTTNPGGTFDGILTGGNVSYSNNGGAITWTATGGLNFTDKVEVYVGGVNPFYVNVDGAGAGSALNIHSWNTIAEAPAAGVNGFHLDFSDSSSDAALGATDDYATTVGAVTTSYSDFYAEASYPPKNLFDGVATSNAIVFGGYSNADGVTGNSDIIWTPNGAYSVSSTLRVFAGYYSNISVNGVSLATGGPNSPESWINLAHTGPITSIKFENTSNDNAVRAAAIEIDGTILTTSAWDVNNLTAAGSAWNQSQTWSNGATGSFALAITRAFDGDLSTTSATGSGSRTITFTDLSVNSSLEVHHDGSLADTITADLGGTTVTLNTASGSGFRWDSADLSSLSLPLAFNSFTFTQNPGVAAIRVDGKLLVDSGVIDPQAVNIDSLSDSPTSNYATLNPVDANGSTSLSNGNLDMGNSQGGSAWGTNRATIGASSGKYFAEYTCTASSGGFRQTIGVVSMDVPNGNSVGSNVALNNLSDSAAYFNNGQKSLNGSTSNYGDAWTVGDVIGIALDVDATTVTFYKNGVSQGVASSALASDAALTFGGGTISSNETGSWNFGQRDFVYPVSGFEALTAANLASTIKDSSNYFNAVTFTGNGSTQSVDIGFSPDLLWIKDLDNSRLHALCDSVRGDGKLIYTSSTLAEQDIGSSVVSLADNGFDLGFNGTFTAVSHNHSGADLVAYAWNAGDTTETIAAGSLTSSLYDQSQTWSTNIAGTIRNPERAFNGVIGEDPQIATAHGGEEFTINFSTPISGALEIRGGDYGGGGTTVVATCSDGTVFPIGNAAWPNFQWFGPENVSNVTSIAFTQPNGGGISLSAIRLDGKLLVDYGVSVDSVPSMASQVRANPAAGFSIVKWTCNGSENQSIGHGLGATPAFMIFKNLDRAANCPVYHKDVTTTTQKVVYLNTTGAVADYSGGSSTWWGELPTSSVFTVGDAGTAVNHTSGDEMITYCFAPVEGYSAIGKYQGNGDADGSFVYTGFKPAFVMVKNITYAHPWQINDTARDVEMPNRKALHPNTTDAETQYSSAIMDILSNGFKLRGPDSYVNASNSEYIYVAFAEKPLNTTPESDGTGDTQVALDALVAAATEIVETDGTTMYLNGATGPWRTGLSIEGSSINAAAPGPSEITFTSQNQGTPAFSGVDATLASRTWTLESGTTATGPWTLVDTYVDYGVLSTQTGATPWTENKPTLQPNTFYRIKVQYDSTNATSVESVYNTFKTGDA